MTLTRKKNKKKQETPHLLEGDGPVNQIQIKVVQLEILEGLRDGFARPATIATHVKGCQLHCNGKSVTGIAM